MKTINQVAAIAIMVGSNAVFAQSYQGEVSADYLHYSYSDGGSGGGYVLRGKYHLTPVQTSGLPLAEAAFLTKSGSIQVEVPKGFDVAAVRGEGYVPNSIFFVGATIVRFDDDFGSETYWQGHLGITPIQGLLITTSFDDDDYDVNFDVKYVTPIGDNYYLNTEVSFLHGEWDNYGSFSADWYFTPRFSAGIGYERLGSNADSYAFRVRHFITEAFSVEVEYADFDHGYALKSGIHFRF